jgi:hypothetical protein
MNTDDINHISINDYFWIRFHPQLINFGFKGLPKDIHYSFSFSEKSLDINFHVTKNNSADPTNKPKITIVCMDKKLLQEWLEGILPTISISLLNKMLQPLDIFELKNTHNNLGFISFKNLEKTDAYELTEQRLVDSFKEISKIKNKTRLKIKGDIEKQLNKWAISDELSGVMFDNLDELVTKFERSVDAGVIVTEEKAISGIRIINRWFSIREDFEPFDFIKEFFPPFIIRHLNWKTKKAIVAIQKAKTFDDTRHLNNPIRLIIKTPTGEVKDKVTA